MEKVPESELLRHREQEKFEAALEGVNHEPRLGWKRPLGRLLADPRWELLANVDNPRAVSLFNTQEYLVLKRLTPGCSTTGNRGGQCGALTCTEFNV